ncbi:hypothetical protein TCAL_04051 [Tigriopus californicus]|uniref:Potassium channel domain-containing protein n=1 Tax=Tigriopus californicus TaxID=6832 RepID=A0A553PFZ8_TIGCA|nr:uncharacterized protein LOC131880710 [Tigriopus californicus]TRY76601.1 hypothetical protein TCAL_04051 [Tigriopus californicus]
MAVVKPSSLWASIRQVWAREQWIWRDLIRRFLSVLGLGFANSTLWLLFAIAMQTIEANYEASYKCGVKRVQRQFIEALWNETKTLSESDWKSLARHHLMNFEDQLHEAVEAGVHSYSGQKAWTISNALLFSFSVASSAGFGVLVPSSPVGMALMLIASFILCPVFFALLTEIVAVHLTCIKWLSFVITNYHQDQLPVVSSQEKATSLAWLLPIQAFATSGQRDPLETQLDENNDPNQREGLSKDHFVNEIRVRRGEEMSLLRDIRRVPLVLLLALLGLYLICGSFVLCVATQVHPGLSILQLWNTITAIGFAEYSPLDSSVFLVLQLCSVVGGMALFSIYVSRCQNMVLQAKDAWLFKHAHWKRS